MRQRARERERNRETHCLLLENNNGSSNNKSKRDEYTTRTATRKKILNNKNVLSNVLTLLRKRKVLPQTTFKSYIKRKANNKIGTK